ACVWPRMYSGCARAAGDSSVLVIVAFPFERSSSSCPGIERRGGRRRRSEGERARGWLRVAPASCCRDLHAAAFQARQQDVEVRDVARQEARLAEDGGPQDQLALLEVDRREIDGPDGVLPEALADLDAVGVDADVSPLARGEVGAAALDGL